MTTVWISTWRQFTLLCDIHYYSHCHTKQYSDYTTNYTKQHNTLTTHFALSATNRAHCRAYRSVPAFLRNLKFLVDLVSRFQKQTCADTFSPHSFTDCLRRAPPPLEWQAPSATHTAAAGVWAWSHPEVEAESWSSFCSQLFVRV